MVGDVEEAISECLRIVHMDKYPIFYQHIITRVFLILDKNSFSSVIYHSICEERLKRKDKCITLLDPSNKIKFFSISQISKSRTSANFISHIRSIVSYIKKWRRALSHIEMHCRHSSIEKLQSWSLKTKPKNEKFRSPNRSKWSIFQKFSS